MFLKNARPALLAVLALPLLAACNAFSPEQSPNACLTCPSKEGRILQSVVVDSRDVASVGDEFAIVALGFYSDQKSAPITTGVTWTTSDPKVLVVNASGNGKALAPGVATLTATVDGRTGFRAIEVKPVSSGSSTSPSGGGSIPPQVLDFIDRGETQVLLRGVWSHGCPPNHAMGGVEFGGNRFMCRFVGTIIGETVDTVVRSGMLACEPGYFMTALNVERNYARCSRNNSVVSAAEVTSASQTSPVSECNGSNSLQAMVMVGFHHERNQMLCAAVPRR